LKEKGESRIVTGKGQEEMVSLFSIGFWSVFGLLYMESLLLLTSADGTTTCR